MEKNRGFILPLLLIILGALVIIGISFGIYKFRCETNVQKSIPAQKISTPTPTPSDETANWKTYTADDTLKKVNINFSLKYPPNWFSTENNPHNSSYVPDVVFSPNKIPDVYTRSSPCFSIMGGIWGTTTKIQDIIAEEDSTEILSASGSKISMAPKVESQENITINGMAGIYRKIIKYGENQVSDEVILKDGSNATYDSTGENFYIIASCPETNSETFNQILSTFKFL